MNRAQYRQAVKNKDMVPRSEISQLIIATRKEVLKKAVDDYSAVLALCLRDKLGFGPERIKRFLEDVSTMFDSISEGYLTVKDVKETLHEEVKIIID